MGSQIRRLSLRLWLDCAHLDPLGLGQLRLNDLACYLTSDITRLCGVLRNDRNVDPRSGTNRQSNVAFVRWAGNLHSLTAIHPSLRYPATLVFGRVDALRIPNIHVDRKGFIAGILHLPDEATRPSTVLISFVRAVELAEVS